MVLLSDSGELSVRYATYIQELQEFFALHDVLCGAPRELGFFAARLSGRDSFPGELASMVRSFIFREGGSIPLDDLRTVVALAVGGPAVEDYAQELQHPLHDLSAFLATVVRTPVDQPSPLPRAEEPENGEEVFRSGAFPAQSLPDFPEPSTSANPFRPHVVSETVLTPAVFAASNLQRSDAAAPSASPAANRRLWAAAAIGLPLLLLAGFLYHQSVGLPPTPYPETQAGATATVTPSMAAPHSVPQTPLSTASAALAQPTFQNSPHAAVPGPSTLLKIHADAQSQPQPSLDAAAPYKPPVLVASTSSPASSAPAPAPSNATSTPSSSPSPLPATSPAHPAAPSTSVAAVIAHQGASGISSGIMSSHLLSSSQPKYPRMAGLTHAEGEVILQAVVSKTGRVSTVKVLSGPRSLRKAAANSVRQWRYRPYLSEGRPADVATIITIAFKAPR